MDQYTGFLQSYRGGAGLELTVCLGASWRPTEKFWSPDRKFWSPTYFIYTLHKNTILYVTLHVRKVTIEERNQLETTRVTLSYKATAVLRWHVSGPKVYITVHYKVSYMKYLFSFGRSR